MTSSTPPVGPATAIRPGPARAIALYALARLGVVAVVAGLLLLAGAPLAVSVLVGLVVALPLSMVLFRGLRGRLDAALADAGARRSTERAALRARLRGEELDGPSSDASQAPVTDPSRSGDRGERESDSRGDRPGQQ